MKLPSIEQTMRQNHVTMADMPARMTSVLIVFGLSFYFLDRSLVFTVLGLYFICEAWGIWAMRRSQTRWDWVTYLHLHVSSFLGAIAFMTLPYLIWDIETFTARLFSFCTFMAALVHCATIRSYHMPFAIVTGIPVILAVFVSVGFDLMMLPTPSDRAISAIVLLVMLSYIAMTMVDFSLARRNLVNARRQAERENQAKTEFLASMSHEVRTPLNGIMGVAQILSGDAKDERDAKQAEVLLGSAKALKALVDDLLDHAKVDAGRLEIRAQDDDLRKIVQATAEIFRAQADAKGIALDVEICDDIPPLLNFDSVRIRQVVTNLMSNALKFTDAGSVELKTRLISMEGDVARVRIWVRDTGIGISQESLKGLFRPYSQADENRERAATGTGLGLAISRGLLRLMDGDLTVESSFGEGTVFYAEFAAGVVLPDVESVTEHVQDPALSVPLRGRRVLVVDDNSSNRFVARAFLEKEKVDVIEAENGQVALDRIRQGGVDLILMDIHMPVLGGVETFRKIKQCDARPKVVALTADASEEDRTRYLSEGMDGFLTKPLVRSDLLSEMSRHLGPEGAGRDAA